LISINKVSLNDYLSKSFGVEKMNNKISKDISQITERKLNELIDMINEHTDKLNEIIVKINSKPSDNNDFKAHKSSPKVCFKCAGENMMKPITDIDTPCERHKSKSS